MDLDLKHFKLLDFCSKIKEKELQGSQRKKYFAAWKWNELENGIQRSGNN